MKIFLSIVAMFALLITLYGCNQDNTNDITSAVTSEVSTPAVCADALRIDELLGNSVDRSLEKLNLLKELPYTYSRESGSPDDGAYCDKSGKLLTDGTLFNSFDKNYWVGFAGATPVDITFDLGEVKHGIADVEMHCLRQLDYGIGLPTSVTLKISDDGNDYSKLAELKTGGKLTQTQEYTYNFYLNGTFSARYIRLSCASQESGWFFIDEISAYTYGSEGNNELPDVFDYYGDYEFSKTEPVYWDDSEADFSKEQNLAKNAKINIVQFGAFSASEANTGNNTLDTSLLTNGVYSTNDLWDSAQCFRFTRGEGRSIILDLSKISTVTRVCGDVLSLESWGIYAPHAVSVSVSENGADYIGVATAFPKNETNDEKYLKWETVLEDAYKARFVKISFIVSPHAAISEIEVFGTKKITPNAVTPDPNAPDKTQLSDSFLTPDEFGINSIVCTPVCSEQDGGYNELTMITAEEFSKYVGYYEDGVLKDTMFDCFLFSPYGKYIEASKAHTFEGWNFYVDSLFVKDRNLEALSECVTKTGKGLNIENFNVPIYLSILRTFATNEDGSVNQFGDIDGDGVNDSFDKIENRKKAIKWIVDTQLERLEAMNLDNLTVDGFYWHEESLMLDDSAELELTAYARDYVHSLGYKLIWIPYYGAEGYTRWKEAGFDLACLQPNYSFSSIRDDDRLTSAAYLAKLYGMCVEIELSNWDNRANIKRYKEYLEYGVKYGYMNAVKIYYIGGAFENDLTLALTSDDEYTRSIYKDTYLFNKRLLDESYDADTGANMQQPEDLNLEEAANATARGQIVANGEPCNNLRITLLPKYGTLRLNADGSFVYTPFKNFTGEDYFEVAAYSLTTVSNAARITITYS